jgi:uncharacterized protein (DUF433 family)
MTTVMDGHIEVDDHGTARIAGTRMRVMHLVMEKIANKWDAEELKRQFQHLSMSQIHAALAYYYDHQSDLDARIHTSAEEAERMHQDAGESRFIARLRGDGHLPP